MNKRQKIVLWLTAAWWVYIAYRVFTEVEYGINSYGFFKRNVDFGDLGGLFLTGLGWSIPLIIIFFALKGNKQ